MTTRPPSRPITDFFKPSTLSQDKSALSSDSIGSDTKRRPWPSPDVARRLAETGEMEVNVSLTRGKSQQNTPRKLIDERRDDIVQMAPTSSLTSLSSTPRLTSSASSTRNINHELKREGNTRIIRSSDTEEDDEYSSDSDSDYSLEDLTVIMARGERPANPNSHPSPNHVGGMNGLGDGGRRSTRLCNIQPSRLSNKKARVVPTLPKAEYKFSLGSLLDKASEEEAAEARLAAIKARIDAMPGSQFDKKLLARKARDIDEKLLASVVGDDDGEDSNERAHRVIQAMERTDALRMDCVCHSFADAWIPPAQKAFPVHALPRAGWQSTLKVPAKREFAFSSGFVEAMCLHKSLPTEVLLWILDEVCIEAREDLSYAYLGVLEAAQEDLEHVVTPEWLDKVLVNRLGASTTATAVDQKLAIQVQPFGASKRKIPSGLESFLNLLIRVSASLSEECMVHAMQLLARLSVDDSILSSVFHQHLIQRCLATLVNALDPSLVDSILHGLSQKIYHAFNPATTPTHLQHSLLTTTLLLAHPSLRLPSRRLALAFFLSSPSPLNLPVSQLTTKLLPAIERRIERMRVTIAVGSRMTENDNDALAAHDNEDWDIVSQIGLLDLGIGAGLDVPTEEEQEQVAEVAEEENATKDALGDNSSTTTNNPSSPQNTAHPHPQPHPKSRFFNHLHASHSRSRSHSNSHSSARQRNSLAPLTRSLARLSAALSSASSGLSMSANHILRTEAKAALDRFVYRLGYACGVDVRRGGSGSASASVSVKGRGKASGSGSKIFGAVVGSGSGSGNLGAGGGGGSGGGGGDEESNEEMMEKERGGGGG